MDKVLAYSDLQEKITMVRRIAKKYHTNFFIDTSCCESLIKKELLYFSYIDGVLFILQKDQDFYHLYYCASGLDCLENGLNLVLNKIDRICVVDIIGQDNSFVNYQDIFLSVGFRNYCSLNRMSRSVNSSSQFFFDERVVYGVLKDAEVVYRLLQHYFDKYCEQLPAIQEVENWIALNHLLVCREKDIIVGFVLFDVIGVTSYLRYWFVHPDYRENKIGSGLLNRFFYESKATKRQLFWVIESNENAIKRYLHYGFKSENMFDKILIYKK